MNHQPFEEWLLHEKLIDPKQKLELDAHMRVCSYCSALADGEGVTQREEGFTGNGFQRAF